MQLFAFGRHPSRHAPDVSEWTLAYWLQHRGTAVTRAENGKYVKTCTTGDPASFRAAEEDYGEVPHRRPGAPGCCSRPTYDGCLVKVVGVMSPTEKREIRAQGESCEEGREALQAPEGWRLLSIMTEC